MRFPDTTADSALYQRIIGTSIAARQLQALGMPPENFIPRIFPRRAFAHFPPVADDDAREHMTLVKISAAHRRSFNIERRQKGGELLEIGELWFDEFGNPFMDGNIKGAEFTRPFAYINETYAYYGIQPTAAIQRAIFASSLLRSARVDTEIILDGFEPLEFHVNGEMGSQDALEKQIVADVASGMTAELIKATNFPNHPVPSEKADEIEADLAQTEFVITERGVQVDERVGDLEHVKTHDEFMALMRRVFHFVNARERHLYEQDSTYNQQYFYEGDPNSVNHFFFSYFPKILAENIAKMHNLGLVHNQLHKDNVSLAGGFYDLDAVTGLLLGDRPTTEFEKVFDVVSILGHTHLDSTLGQIVQTLTKFGYMHTGDRSADLFARQFATNFLASYIAKSEDASKFFADLLQVYETVSPRDGYSGGDSGKFLLQQALQAKSFSLYIQSLAYFLGDFDSDEIEPLRDIVLDKFNEELGYQTVLPDLRAILDEFLANDRKTAQLIATGEINVQDIDEADERFFGKFGQDKLWALLQTDYAEYFELVKAKYGEGFMRIIRKIYFGAAFHKLFEFTEKEFPIIYDSTEAYWRYLQAYK